MNDMSIASPSPTTIPGPRPKRLTGRRGNLRDYYRDPIGFMMQLYREFGEIAAYVQGGNTFAFFFGPAYNRQILTNPDLFYSSVVGIPFPPGSAAERLDSGVICMNGPQHRRHRRLILPAFHKKQVETYRDDMVVITQHMLDRWHIGQLIDVNNEMRQLTARIATKTLFGFDDIPDQQRVIRLISRVSDLSSSSIAALFPVNLIGTPYWQLLRASERVDALLRTMIGRKRADPATQRDILATLIHMRDEDGDTMSDAELIGHAYVLYVAGHDTSSNALTWTLFLLAQHPHILHDLLDELEGVLHSDAPTIEQLGRLPLLERVIKESMRLLPPAYAGARYTTAPTSLGPYHIPAWAGVMYSEYVTHRIPELYPEPERFLPQRWETIDPSPYEYLPFSAGSRMCLGATFAMLEMKLALTMIVQRFRLDLLPGTRIDRKATLTLAPRYGMPMRVAPQDRRFTCVAVRGNIREMVDLNTNTRQ